MITFDYLWSIKRDNKKVIEYGKHRTKSGEQSRNSP